jgi:DNA-binding NtrC family response regulator
MADDIIECDITLTDAPAKPDDGTTITIRVGTPLEEVERRVTMATLAYCGHVKRKAAEILGVSLKTLYNRLETYNGRDSGSRPPSSGKEEESDSSRESLR